MHLKYKPLKGFIKAASSIAAAMKKKEENNLRKISFRQKSISYTAGGVAIV